MGGHLGASPVPKEPAALNTQCTLYQFQLPTYHAHWYNQAYDVQHPVAHSGLLEGMLQRFIVTEEAALVRIPKQKEPKYGQANCKIEKNRELEKAVDKVNGSSKSILHSRLSENISRHDLSICI